MKLYRVDRGVAKFGPGAELQLSPAQIAPRQHNLELPKGYDGKQSAVVKTTQAVEFKVGEKIGLTDLPRNLTDMLVPVGEPTSETEKLAVAKAKDSKAAEKIKAKTAA